MVDVVVSEAQLNIPQAINTLFIVRNVKVLAVHTWPTQNQVLPPNWTSLVVAVTPEQGEKLGTASPPRQSSIVLRQPGN
jgi:Flp pilus assembly protein CpaB